jgi:hypothetical protein
MPPHGNFGLNVTERNLSTCRIVLSCEYTGVVVRTN